MTDYTKLIEELRLSAEIEAQNKGSEIPDFEEYWMAADAIGAMQAENEQLTYELQVIEENHFQLKKERDALQAKVDAMAKGEAVASIYITADGDREMDDWKCDLPLGRNELYAAPKALAPLTDEQIYNVFASTVKEAEPFLELVGDPIWAEVVEITRAIEAAHFIK